ncbi:hypothetical protein AMAG_18979 [Allomyces macrogynus ATCC 38327]|uniref:Uncharacterized protein n=1 Tax=Allomyces macrogynus (strain ATCC 38327) TaxID=578462 RepID=A0A0L0SLJ6_ALLM3|nr:hypothetical protein AMAG_18979 [Allomyces macrogynus ATCC 38327]|eukprot:KNE63259.1 hypothetical protein AMAG_18979 [Allomyces macrogynus ATCC 38327]
MMAAVSLAARTAPNHFLQGLRRCVLASFTIRPTPMVVMRGPDHGAWAPICAVAAGVCASIMALDAPPIRSDLTSWQRDTGRASSDRRIRPSRTGSRRAGTSSPDRGAGGLCPRVAVAASARTARRL